MYAPQNHATPQQSDEIDLFELAQNLWREKLLIIAVTVLFTAGALAYAFTATPTYETSVKLLPPSLSDVAGFNIGRVSSAGLAPYKVADVYAVFTRNLTADESKRWFFNDIYPPSLPKEESRGLRSALYAQVNEQLSVKASDKARPDQFTLTVQDASPEKTTAWANAYIKYVAELSLDQMIENATRESDVMGRNIKTQIKVLRDTAEARRKDRIEKLTEALGIAESIGLENAPVIGGQIDQQLSAIMDGSLMYMRGSKALKAEIKTLVERKSDDPFIDDLRSLQEKLKMFESMKPDREQVAVFRQDGQVVVPDRPIKPKKSLIVALGLVLGGMAGVFIALVRVMLKKHRKLA
ncbi:MAG: LPS O-antigen chain length determinant protein WzzB [Pseudomonas sp.]